MARAQGARAQMALATETTYGTAPASGYVRMPFASSTLGLEQPLLENELLGYGRDPLAPARDAVSVDGDIVVPIDAVAWDRWLNGAFGAPTVSGETKTYESGKWALPSFTIATAMPEVPRLSLCTGCMVDRLTWRMERNGLLTATVGLIGQAETVSGDPLPEVPAGGSVARFNHFNGAVKRNGTTLGNVESVEITYANNLDRVETIRSDGKIDGADPGMAMLSGRMTVRFSDMVLMDQAIGGAPAELEFAYGPQGFPDPTGGAGSISTSWKLTAHAVYLPRPRVSVQGPQGIRVDFDWQAALQADGEPMCTVERVYEVIAAPGD